MSGLGLRMALSLAVAALIGMLAVDVAFVFWTHERELHAHRAEARAALEAVGAVVRASPRELDAELAQLAAEHGVVLSLAGGAAPPRATASVVLPAELGHGRGAVIGHGFEHLARALPGDSPWAYAVVSRRLDEPVRRTLARQPVVLAFLACAAAGVVGVGLWFMRRSVLRPLARLSESVSAHDQDALLRFGASADDDLARLGRGIIAMTQRLDEDRQRIAAQLAELQEAHRRLEATRDQLVRAERLAAVGRLAAGLAHEVGNPLAVLTGYVALLDDPTLPAEQRREALQRMDRELHRIQGTVRSLLDFSRAPISAQGEASLADVLAHLAGLLEPQLRKRQIVLELPRAAALRVGIDAGALTQVLLNLVLNAVDALGGAGTVRVSAAQEADAVRVSVEDSGPGVPAELVGKIFEPFFTTKPAGVGTGLGLAVCESIATAAGGELGVDRSPELGGARFTLRLPG